MGWKLSTNSPPQHNTHVCGAAAAAASDVVVAVLYIIIYKINVAIYGRYINVHIFIYKHIVRQNTI